MIVKTDKTKCTGCTACTAVCSMKCINMEADNEGFLYPVIDESRCIHCGICDAVCPAEHPVLRVPQDVKTWGAKVEDDSIRMESSSGGVFSHLALETLRNGGVVFGAALRDDCRSVHHVMVDREENLGILRGSKYVQSDLEDSLNVVKEQLDARKQVLFSGTPCQIVGLKSALGKEYENLLSVAIICHGVPSPALWEKYVVYSEEKMRGKIQSVFFRGKRNGWKGYEMQFVAENERRQYLPFQNDPFLQMFLRNQCLRPSCYQCASKKGDCGADLILGDFWGVESVVPELDDNKGTSLVLALTNTGEQIFLGLQDLQRTEVETEKALKGNSAYSCSVFRPKERDTFFSDLGNMQFPELQRKYLRLTPKQKVIRTLDKMHLLQLVCKVLGK